MNIKTLVHALIISLCLFHFTAFAVAPYRGPGGQLEAAGKIFGTFLGTAVVIEACERHATLKEKAQRTIREYTHRNQQVYMDVMRKLPSLAKANGGDAEVQRLKGELETVLTAIETAAKKSATAGTQVVADAEAFLDEVNRGLYDLEIRNNNEVTKILK